jgi:hypothetical protein
VIIAHSFSKAACSVNVPLLLSPMRGVVRGIQVDHNQAAFAFQLLGAMFNDDIRQFATRLEKVFA